MLRSLYMITKRTKAMLVVLVLVALGAYAYLYWWSSTPDHGVFDTIPVVRDASDAASNTVVRQQPAKPAAPAATATTTSATYRTYEDTTMEFSFAYPDNWVVSKTETSPTTNYCLNFSEGTGGCLASVAVTDESVNASVEKSIEALEAEFRAGRVSDSTRRIAGEEATLIQVSGYPTGQENSTRAAVFAHENRIYVVEAAAGQEAVFDRITSSFAFQD